MSWIRSLDIVGIFITLSGLIYASIEGVDLKLVTFSFFVFIILTFKQTKSNMSHTKDQ